MTKIAMYNVSPIEVPYIEDWAKKNDVDDRPGLDQRDCRFS